ncbi:E3 ubiquitin-protein ligase KEG isoform X2 [Cryptomeria japonica]|uniref:E3 ubiquitin-protein ligase KEG isoform X2 n=1 Tax=Cryptomeria japonica TaxID=3369 RepID=UPI0025AB9E3B|nr:E3 ubiquitin-protein ligase KEG isoform X2 [Cryptomeria japonica]
MSSHTGSSSPSKSTFEYELLEGDAENLKTVAAPPIQSNPWIDPGALRITHRIGRGPFGDIWIATLHYTEGYDEPQEVAVKMLKFMSEEQVQPFMAKFQNVFYKCREKQHVCWPYGLSLKQEKICIVMKLYEGSVGDKMAQLKGDRLPLSDILRYGTDVAQGVLELHSQGILVLNLKPFNLLLDEHDQAVLGDFGIPMLLQGIPLSSSDLTLRLGTPNYMAPEQWEADVKGPVSWETDCWGFGCSIVEMFTGIRPWYGRSAEEIYAAVVIRHEKPKVPSGLPCAIESILKGCFEYDFRNRPSFADILFALKNPNAIFGDSGWICARDKSELKGNDVQNCNWLFLKDKLQVGDYVRSRKIANLKQTKDMSIVEGTIVGMDSDMYVLVRVHGLHDPMRMHSSHLERVSLGFGAGDWVRLHGSHLQNSGSGEKQSPVGILHSISRDGKVEVAFLGLETLLTGHCSELQMSESFSVGEFVRVKLGISSPRFQWPHQKNGWDTGRIEWIFPNGCLMVKFPGRLFGNVPCLADPAEVELVQFKNCVGIVKKYHHLESVHWAVRPVIVTLGFLTVLKLGMFVGCIGSKARRRKIKQSSQQPLDAQTTGQDPHNSGNAPWLPPSVANIFSKKGLLLHDS